MLQPQQFDEGCIQRGFILLELGRKVFGQVRHRRTSLNSLFRTMSCPGDEQQIDYRRFD